MMANVFSNPSCAICSLHQNLSHLAEHELWRSDRWLLRHHPQPSPLAGWCLLDSRRHLGGPIDFAPAEAREWGLIVQQAAQLVKAVSDCDRVYAIAFGEGARHLHLHLIPRHGDDDRSSAWSVADLYRRVEAGAEPAASAKRVQRFIAEARAHAPACFGA